ncbi:thiolase family protein [Curvivirga aplysinae]|uniref:thiolase family protein n=1 Tax=Curvivirga aplysinae TaxID=2529852 RepID=UPI0012BB738F|nr:thiolase family protein [Curvivirga aplysinae]MTI08352.1 thiolase family protein [Curvivirga aplysinae]
MTKVYMIAAKRSAVVPRHGAFASLDLHDLAAPVIKDLLKSVKIKSSQIDSLFLGNALYGGGNPARMTALAAKLPERMPSFSIDTQCCSGMDSIILAAQRVASGQDKITIAGGAESYSRSPRRFKRAFSMDEEDMEYLRPPFAPWPDRDPDMLTSAAKLAADYEITRQDQEKFAIESHRKSGSAVDEITPIHDITTDQFTRNLSAKTCAKLPVLEGGTEYGLTSATTAVEADAAAFIILTNQEIVDKLRIKDALLILDSQSQGGDPIYPALAPIAATRTLMQRQNISTEEIDKFEVMEAFAVQAMIYQNHFNISSEKLNLGGGGLSRGHAIGASGAINLVRLWYELQNSPSKSKGLAAIAAAGGLGTAILLEKP